MKLARPPAVAISLFLIVIGAMAPGLALNVPAIGAAMCGAGLTLLIVLASSDANS